MKARYLFLLTAFCINTTWADFSDALFRLHPAQPMDRETYLIEVTGEWPTDCHPGEQKPVIRDYTEPPRVFRRLISVSQAAIA